MKAILMLRQKRLFEDGLWAEAVVWELPEPVKGSGHSYKYRLALIDRGICVLRYDNEAGKGDHKHIGEREVPYDYSDISKLLNDFQNDCDAFRKRRLGR